MATQLKVRVVEVIPEFAKIMKEVNFRDAFPNTLAALNMVAYAYMEQWRRYTMGERIPGSSRKIYSRGDYTRSINLDIGNDTTKIIYSQASKPYTEWIEEGHGEIDLKPGMLAGPKHRMGKFGPYNIISFRQGVPGTLPSNAPMTTATYQKIKNQTDKADADFKKKLASKPGTSRIISSTRVDDRVVRSYLWGYRLPASSGGQRKTKHTTVGDYTWKTGKYTGMVRMETSAGGRKSSEYRTFRVVSFRSDPASWIVPAIEGVPIRQAVVNALKDAARDTVLAAMEKDLGV